MKRMYKYSMLVILAAAIPLTAVFGQEKKNEQKIKVVINDGSGEKTVLDTTFTGGKMPEKIELKDGNVIYLGEKGTTMTHISTGEGNEKVFITVSSDGDGKKEVEKKVIIMSGDSVKWTAKPGEKHVYSYSTSKSTGGKAGEKTFDITVETGDNDTDLEKTKYVIAKDGFVVTVEGNDEAKARELIKEIESKLGVKEEGNVKKEVVKEESKKSVKK